jgi:hypothetical protein
MSGKVLHILSQRPGRTGSGVTLEALVRQAAAAPGIPIVAVCHATGLRQMELTPHLRDEVIDGCRRIDPAIRLVEPPRLENVDQPVAADLPRFTADLASALADALDRPPESPPDLDAFTWASVFRRTESIWRELVG